MRSALLGLVCLCLIASSTSIFAGPLEEGTAAADRRDYGTAIGILQPMADAGDTAAQLRLGKLFAFCGSGCKYRSGTSAIKWLRLAAEKGSVEAQSLLGMIFNVGAAEVTKDKTEANKWFALAAAAGDAFSQVMLGGAYHLGEGVPINHNEAAKLFRMAAEQGDLTGMSLLGSLYESGEGVPQDYVMAHMWFNLAASRPSPRAPRPDDMATKIFGDSTESDRKANREARERVATQMTRGQIAEAQRLAREWKPAAGENRTRSRDVDR
jgi:uncharacterized protein